MTSFFLDPTVIFTILVVFLPIALELDEPNIAELAKIYLLHPPFLISLSSIIILEIGALIISPQVKKEKIKSSKGKQPKGLRIRRLLSSSEYMVSRWYLMNGAIYHSLMDPICGFMQNWSLMTKQYNNLDERFNNPYKVGAESATLTIWLEGGIMCPGCILIFIGYRYILPRIRKNYGSWNKSKYSDIVWIYCLEFIVLLCQSLGTYFFYGTEFILLITKQETNMPFAKNINKLNFNIWELFYFWFGTVFMVGLWIIIPIILMIRAYKQIIKLLDIDDDDNLKRRKKRN